MSRRPLLIAGGLAVAVAPFLLGEYPSFVAALAITYALVALSLVVLTGWSGQLNLHVAALGLGLGSYSAFALVRAGTPVALAILLAGIASIPVAVLVAAAAVRFRGLELAVATLAVGLIFERLAFRNIAKALSTTSFASSFVSFARPSGFASDRWFYVFALVVAAILFGIVTRIGRGAIGRTLRAIREREISAEVAGVPVVAYRIGAFVLSSVVAATAGGLFASLKTGITPDSFSLDLSFTILAAAVIGGIGSPLGAVIAGVLAAVLPEIGRSGPLSFLLAGERLFLVFGAGMIIALWKYPKGIAGVLAARRVSPEVAEVVDDAVIDARATKRLYHGEIDRLTAPTMLRIDGITVRFGGVTALDGVSLTVPKSEICAIIGPNGAGKSTLFNVVAGLVRPVAGRVYLDGRDVTEMSPHRRAALGLGRTFQSVEVFRTLTVKENVETGGLRAAGDILETLGLAQVAHAKPGDLSLGTLRLVEIATALAHDPQLLLLDEPTAGLDAAERERLCDVVARLRSAYGLTVVLVEHDMSVVAALADHVFALDFGRIIAAGTAAKVRRDPIVVEKYLGAAHARKTSGRRLAGARR